ncbi:MAG: tagaturonate epimerase family protein [Oscillospiraceae bacterium]|nr:tagaturonate epimerase family protein [Oscillospiraceae bacterium]
MNYIDFIKGDFAPANAEACGVYERSVNDTAAGKIFMADLGDRDAIAAPAGAGFRGEAFEAAGARYVLAPLEHVNADRLRTLLPFTAPAPVLRERRSVGTGDRLGVACDGHLRVFERYDAMPVLAQQSIRELTLTNRTFEDVLDAASFAVFRCGFKRGFGADGDHLKTGEEIEYALRCGYTMITLDCSEHIHNDAASMTPAQLDAAYAPDAALEGIYLDRDFAVTEDMRLHFSGEDFRRAVLIYKEAIDFAETIYKTYIEKIADRVDFEMSIDETLTPTAPLQHFFVANELRRRGVKVTTIAPRFCGEFQKGVDYRGDLAQFEKELRLHADIARYFGYKLSIHSGSDKFSVFQLIGKYTQGNFHLKTAGTSWLEAMKLVAIKDPSLYREIHTFALGAFDQARKYYHVSTDLSKIPDIGGMTDAQLPELFRQDDARQLIHITYGLILNAKDAQGGYLFHDRLYVLWRREREAYAQLLDAHIGRHLELLYSGWQQ